jgi:two-component system sensor histidine kinase KdpD
LKTPLTAVSVAANNLDASWLDPEQRHEQADIVRTELERLNRLFNNIVDMARIETQAVNAEFEWVAPEEIVEAATRQVDRTLAGHPVTVESDNARVLVRLDPRLTSAALAHVLENAAQYSPMDSTISVTVAVQTRPHGPAELVITVRDWGVGLASVDIDRVFDQAYRGGDARQIRFGSGMGLSITRGLLAAQGGRVRADGTLTRGAAFTIAVPVEWRHAPAPEAEPVV